MLVSFHRYLLKFARYALDIVKLHHVLCLRMSSPLKAKGSEKTHSVQNSPGQYEQHACAPVTVTKTMGKSANHGLPHAHDTPCDLK